jgi:LuxR family maltose regulon positive regulatory protein
VEAEAVAEARALVSDLPDEEHDELSSLLDVCVAATELLRGSVDEAAATLRRHVQRSVGGPASRAARTDCAGQLALIEAFRGNLRVSERLVDSVLHGPGDESGPGALHAHLASAWIHLERVEPAPARQQLDLVADAAGLEPWLVVARQVAEARLLALSGQPEVAVRVAVPALKAAQARYQSGWLVDLLSLAAAEALLAAGEPRRALDLVTPYPGSTAVLATVLAAQARIGLGDAAGARADLGSVTDDLACAPLDFQIEAWLLEASIAQAGDEERARLLVDRALRTAAVESLRRPFTQQSEWLGTLLDRDAALRRAHSGFLAGLRPQAFLPARRSAVSVGSETLVVETLTVREAQVLELLAEMCSTDEIAGELFLSVNTVKTYVRGILRKLGVNRRVDAVRKGRELGLC